MRKIFAGSNDRIVFLAICVIVLLRFISIGLMGLMPQDAYYYFYGEHLALSYFDHPPAIAYLLRFFTEIFGKKAFVIKMTDSVITLLSIWFFYKLARRFLTGFQVRRAVVLFFSTLMVTVLSLVSTPDVPLILFWTISLLMLHSAIFLEKKMYWIWAGITMGLAFDSKYTAIFLPAGLILFLLLSDRYRGNFRSAWFWSSPLAFFIVISPVISWNVQNHFASFRFQSQQRMETMGGIHLNLTYFFGTLGHQTAILMPVLFFAVLYYVFRSLKKFVSSRLPMSSEQLFLLCFFLPVFFGFMAISIIYWVKLNWMMPAYITGIILVSRYIHEKWVRWQLACSFLVHIILGIEILFYPIPVRSDDTWFGWKILSAKVIDLNKKYSDAFIFSSDDYKTSAVLNFYLDSMVYGANVIGERALQFDYIGTDLSLLRGRNALFINSVPNFSTLEKEKGIPEFLLDHFNTVTQVEPILINKGKRTVRKFLIYYCVDYHLIKKAPTRL